MLAVAGIYPYFSPESYLLFPRLKVSKCIALFSLAQGSFKMAHLLIGMMCMTLVLLCCLVD